MTQSLYVKSSLTINAQASKVGDTLVNPEQIKNTCTSVKPFPKKWDGNLEIYFYIQDKVNGKNCGWGKTNYRRL